MAGADYTPHLQKFESIHNPIYNLHYFPRNKFSSANHRELHQAATNMWCEIACLQSS